MDVAQTRHVLLLDDPGPVGLHATSPDCTIDEAHRALKAVAGMHAKWWDSEKLKEFSSLASGESQSLMMAAPRKFRASWDAVKERFSGRLPDGLEEVGDRYGPVIPQIMQRNAVSRNSPWCMVSSGPRTSTLVMTTMG